MLLSDIDTWNVGALQSIAFELGDELKTIEGVAGDLELISRLPGWDSPAADAARGKIHSTTGKVLDDAAAIGAVQQLAEETSAAVAKLQSELEPPCARTSRRQGGFLQLAANGDVTFIGPPDIREELQPIADNIEARAKALIHQAEDIDADCAEVFAISSTVTSLPEVPRISRLPRRWDATSPDCPRRIRLRAGKSLRRTSTRGGMRCPTKSSRR